jgi:hypothetical protein
MESEPPTVDARLVPSLTGVLVWLGLYLRSSTVRALVRSSG